ncbi:Fe-S cluster assembly protein SufD, partial [Micromonospora fluostatini]
MTTQASAPPPSTKSQALRSYDVADFPALTGLEEEWRFTPLKRLRGLTGEAQAPTGAVRHEYGDLPAGVTVDRIGADDARVGSVLTPVDRISALAYGGASTALLLAVAPEAVVTEPVTLRVVGDGAEGLAFGHTVVEVGRFAEATVVVEHV